ncbi:glycosyltransferase [Coraliomargarita parva]|uniref:glycosyltransferase n=1 Tax=Coraliomargarita parva TaxID=3014050 RepID=UPI0022B30EB1|nr:glycosyltransferase [Coraliomargarita parva]
MDYSIIVPAYNEAEELPATLQALRAAMDVQKRRGELIVVDNNSSDATAEVAGAHGADRVVFEPVNQIARARNAGAGASRGRQLVFVDADTRIDAGLLEQSLAHLDGGHCVGGGARIEFEGKPGWIGRVGIGLWKRISQLTRTAAGSYLFCRRDAFEAIGGFDERLYASEEVRLSHQLKRWGRPKSLRFVIVPEPPAQTSARKLDWYSGPAMLGWVAFMILVPVAVRSRKFCGFWYKRPVKTTD